MTAESLRSRLPKRITIVEVAARDGLQAEERILPTEAKLHLLDGKKPVIPNEQEAKAILDDLQLGAAPAYPLGLPSGATEI